MSFKTWTVYCSDDDRKPQTLARAPRPLPRHLMIVLDVTIVNVALPSIQEDLGFSEDSLAWVVNAYLITFGGFLLLGGRFGDLFGHRRLFLIGIGLFTVASLLCGLAPSQGLLVVARALQGVGGAVVSAVSFWLMMMLSPRRTRRSDGHLRLRRLGRRLDRRAARRDPHGRPQLALDLPRQRPGRLRRPRPHVLARTRRARLDGCAASRHRRRGDGDGGSDDCCLRNRERERGRLDDDSYPRAARRVRRPARRVRPHRGAREVAARAARPLPATQRLDRERHWSAVGGGDVRVVLHVRPLPPAGPRLQPARGRPDVPAGEPHHGRLLDRALGEARTPLRHQAAARRRGLGLRRSASRCSRARRWTETCSPTSCRA